MCQKLDAGVDRQRQIGAVLRLTTRADLLDDPTEVVLDHAPAARLACKALLLRQLEAFLPDIFHVGEADHVGDGLAFRIVALVFIALMDSGDLQGRDPAGHLGFDLPLQIDIVLVLGQLAIELATVDAQQSGQPELLLGCRDDIVGVSPDRLGRQTAGQHRARAVDDLAADRWNL